MVPLSVRVVAIGLVLGLPFQAVADGGRLFNRGRVGNTVQCQPSQVVAAPIISTTPGHVVALPAVSSHLAGVVQHGQVVATPFVPYAVQQPLVIQNNYPAPLVQSGSTLYGYYQSQTTGQTYGSLPLSAFAQQYQVDPTVLLAQAAAMAKASNELAQSSVQTYERLSQQVIAQQTQMQQMMARASLLQATGPVGALPQLPSSAPTAVQSIRITPNGDGSFSISLENGDTTQSSQPTVPELPPVPPMPQPNTPPAPEPAATPIHPGINVLAQHCGACHTGPGAKGGLQLFPQPNTYAIQDQATMLKMWESITEGRMPLETNAAGQPLPRLSVGELAAVRDYLIGQ